MATGFKFNNGGATTDFVDAFIKRDFFSTGGIFSIGDNGFGQLGDGTITNRSSPVQVGSLTNWKKISCGQYSTMAIKVDGTLWTWGYNAFGQLGDGTITNRSSPVQVGLLTNWKQISGGQDFTIAVKTDGTLWAWGRNDIGQLGLGDLTPRSSPVQVGSLTNWKQAAASNNNIGATSGFIMATKTDGTLWAWGYNGSGQLGLGDLTPRSSPVQVGSLTTWNQVDAEGGFTSVAIKIDGTLWAWGSNSVGQLGIGTSGVGTNTSSPVQVGALTNWKQVTTCYSNVMATKTDGTLWAWGYNNFGQLGLGDTTNRSSPTQVGLLTNWKQVAGGTSNTGAIKTDGTLWTWGANGSGELGQNNTTPSSSPIQIGSLTNWKQVAYGADNLEVIFDISF